MRPYSLRINNLYSHENSYLNFRRKRLSLVVGEVDGQEIDSNTAGKSSIFDSINFCLFGTTRSGNDHLVRDGSNSGSGDLIFKAHDGNVYRVVRKIKIAKNGSTNTEVSLYYFNKNSWARKDGDLIKGKTGIQKEINKIVGMDDDIFSHSVLLQQHEIGAFALADSGERRDLLKKFVPMELWDNLDEIEKYRIKNTKDELDTEKKLSEDLEKRIEDPNPIIKQISDLNSDIEKHEVQIKQKSDILSDIERRLSRLADISKLLESKISIEKNAVTTASLISQIEESIVSTKKSFNKESEDLKFRSKEEPNLLKKKDILLSEIADYSKLNIEKEKLSVIIKSLREETSLCEQYIAVNNAKMQSIASQKKNIKELDGNCPLCLSDVHPEHKVKIFESLAKEYGSIKIDRDSNKIKSEKLKEDLILKINEENDLSIKINSVVSKKFELQSIQDSLNRFESDKKELSLKKSKATSQIEQFTLKKKDAESNLEQVKSRLAEITKEFDEAKKDGENETTVKQFHIKVKNDLVDITLKLSSFQKYLGESTERLNRSVKMSDELKLKLIRIDDLQKKYNVQRLVEKAVGKHGIQALIIENWINNFEAYTRNYLKRFTRDKYDIKFETTSTNKKGDNTREVLDIMIDKGNGKWHPYKSFSGSESTKIGFALRMGLAKTSGLSGEGKPDFLFVDEVGGTMDAAGRTMLSEVLSELTKDFSLILVVTHFPELQDQFSDLIKVKKTGFISTISDKDIPEAEDLIDYELAKTSKEKPVLSDGSVDDEFHMEEAIGS